LSHHIQELGLTLVPAEPRHRGFVISTWVRSAAESWKKKMPYSVVVDGESKAAERLYPYVHVLTSDGDSIHGWCCGKPGLLHYAYVPPELRGSGIGGLMVRAVCGPDVTYTRDSLWCRKMYTNSKFNPYRCLE
jgi:hypothetical protein